MESERQKQGQGQIQIQQQIPRGNDRKKSNGNGKYKYKYKYNGRFLSGMTKRKAGAKATVGALVEADLLHPVKMHRGG